MVIIRSVLYWLIICGFSAPFVVAGVVATWLRRSSPPGQDDRSGALSLAVATTAILVVALDLMVAEPVLAAWMNDRSADRWDAWLARALWLWLVACLLAFWRDLSSRDIGFTGRLAPQVRRWVLAGWAVSLPSGGWLIASGQVTVTAQLLQWPLNPLAEELLFRGLILALLAQALGRRSHQTRPVGWAVAAVVVLFGISHFVQFDGTQPLVDLGDPAASAGVFVMGLLLWFVYARTGSIWPPVTMHDVVADSLAPASPTFFVASLTILAFVTLLLPRIRGCTP
ncbi:MAG: CPBP family glutamic-type intramembrane protease [Dermatophilaceae bacterium]